MSFRPPDMQLLLALGLGLFGVAVVSHFLLGAWALTLLVPLAALSIAALVLGAHRSLLQAGERQRTQVQALLALHQLLPLRRPLPPMEGWACTPELAALVVGEILERRPELVVEIGSGVSSVVSAYALEKSGRGRLVSLDNDPDYAAQTRANIVRHGHTERVVVLDAPLVSHTIGVESWRWYDCSRLTLDQPIDLLVVDGPALATQPLARYPALPLLLDRLAPDAVVILDDAARRSEQGVVRRWLREHPGAFSHTYHPTLKGVAILRRRQ